MFIRVTDGAAVGFFEFLFGIIVFMTVSSMAVTYFAGRAAWRGGKRLIGWVRNQRQLPGETQNPSVEARDVVVEDVDDAPAPSKGRPVEPSPHLRKTKQRDAYERLDVDEGATVDDVMRIMRRLKSNTVLGSRAQAVIDTLNSAELRRQSLSAELDGTFQHGSISWAKFAAPSESALDAILRNSVLLANRMQSFDTAGYLRLKESMGKDWRNGDDMHNQTREQRWKLFKGSLEAMDTIQETNEGLLLELDKLESELVTISASGADDADESILEEIRRLVDEAKYYR